MAEQEIKQKIKALSLELCGYSTVDEDMILFVIPEYRARAAEIAAEIEALAQEQPHTAEEVLT